MPASEPAPDLRDGIRGLLGRFGLPDPGTEEGWRALEQAFVHRSWSAEHPGAEDNERLEFLGDAVIGFTTSRYLFELWPHANEGDLSKLRAAMVSRRVLGKLGLEMGLDRLVRLGVGEEANGGRRRQSIIGSALEAFCGSLSLAYVWDVLEPAVRTTVVVPTFHLTENRLAVDYKSRLQEWSQKHVQSVPDYALKASEGPDHDRKFVVEVRAGKVTARGEGTRIKWAENEAARKALEEIERTEDGGTTARQAPEPTYEVRP